MNNKNNFLKSLFLSVVFLSSSFVMSMENNNSKVFEFKKLPLDIQKVIINDFLEIKDISNVKLVSKDFKNLVNENNLNEKKRIANILGIELINVIMDPEYGFDKSKEFRAKEIINSGKANLNSQDDDGYTPLIRAAYKRQKELIQLLIDRGAEINFENKFCENVLEYALRYRS